MPWPARFPIRRWIKPGKTIDGKAQDLSDGIALAYLVHSVDEQAFVDPLFFAGCALFDELVNGFLIFRSVPSPFFH